MSLIPNKEGKVNLLNKAAMFESDIYLRGSQRNES